MTLYYWSIPTNTSPDTFMEAYSQISGDSSEPSGQSFSPSQRQPLEIQVTWSLHTNCLELQVLGWSSALGAKKKKNHKRTGLKKLAMAWSEILLKYLNLPMTSFRWGLLSFLAHSSVQKDHVTGLEFKPVTFSLGATPLPMMPVWSPAKKYSRDMQLHSYKWRFTGYTLVSDVGNFQFTPTETKARER